VMHKPLQSLKKKWWRRRESIGGERGGRVRGDLAVNHGQIDRGRGGSRKAPSGPFGRGLCPWGVQAADGKGEAIRMMSVRARAHRRFCGTEPQGQEARGPRDEVPREPRT